jgi:hypothetical protein
MALRAGAPGHAPDTQVADPGLGGGGGGAGLGRAFLGDPFFSRTLADTAVHMPLKPVSYHPAAAQ